MLLLPPLSTEFSTFIIHCFNKFYSFAVLSIAPGDEDAIRCKVVALIRADDIDKALSTIQSSQRPTVDFSFFKVGFSLNF